MTTIRTPDTVEVDDDSNVTLSDDQVAEFHRDGFMSLDHLTTADEVIALQSIYDRLFESDAEIADRDRLELAGAADAPPALPQIVNPDQYAPELRETVAYRNAKRVAGQLLGPDMEPAGMHAIRKPPRDGAATPWHQDEAYWDPSVEHSAISIWVPLQDVTLENGCMQFVGGTHVLEVQPHQLINPDSHGLAVVDPDSVGEAVACPLPAGGATVHTSRTMHYAGPNTTDGPRRALIMAFATKPTPLKTPRSMPWQRPEWSE
jgi:hypothetical protein